MATIPVLTQIQNLGSATLPVTPATNLTVLSQNGVARKVTVNDLINGAHPTNLTVDYLTVVYDATVGGTLGVTGNVSVNTNKFVVTASSGNTSVAGNITVGTLSAVAGGSKFGRAGYDATAFLVDMQSAGSNANGSGYGTLKVQQQITHAGSASEAGGAIGNLYATISTAGSPRTDYYAMAALNTVSALRDPLGPATGSQHGAIFNHLVKNLPSGGVGSGKMADGWAQWQVFSNRTGLPSSTGGADVGVEFDWDGNNADDAGARYGYQMVINTYNKAATSTNAFEVKYGFYINSGTGGVNDSFFNIPLAIYPGYTVAGIDLSQGQGPRANPYIDAVNRAVAIKLADNRAVSWDGGDLTTGAILVHGSSKLSYKMAGTEMFSISDTGKIVSASTATDSFTFPGGGTVGPSDFRQVELCNASTSEAASTTAQTLQVRRVGSNNSDFTTNDSWVTASSWVMTNTSAFPSGTVLRRPRFNGKFSTSIADGILPGETWNLFSSISTSAAEDASNTPYNNVAFYSQAVRADSPTVGVGTRVLAAVIEARDLSGDSAVKSGIIRTLELDMFVNGDDDYIDPSTGLPGIGREAMLFALGKGTTGASPTITSLIGVYPTVGDGVILKRGITFANQLNFTQSLWDTRDSVQGASANALWLKSGHRIALDGDSVAAATPSTNYLYYDSTNTLINASAKFGAGTSVISPRIQATALNGTAVNRSWTGSTAPLNFAGFYESYTPSGTPTSGTVAYNYIAINGDSVDGTNVAATAPNAFALFHNIGGMTMKAGRIAHKVVLTQTSAMAADAAGGPLGGHFIASSAQTSVAYSDGGTGLTDANARGSAYAFYPQCNFGATATNWVGQFGFELDMKAVAGSSMVHKIGHMIVLTSGDAVQGAEDDIGISFNGDDDVPGWKVLFGLGRHIAPMTLDTAGSVMAVIPQYNATTRNNVAANGIDLRMIDFSGVPFAASAAAYEVAGDGTVSTGGLQITPTTTGVKLTMSRQVASVTSVAGTLTGYAANQYLYDDYGGIVNIDTVDGSGNVTAASFVSGKEAWSASPPANPVGLSGGSHAGIADQGVTLNYTWTAVTDITIGDSGDKIAFYDATPQAQQTVTGAKGGNAALQNLLTALANLGIIVDGTT